LQTEYSLWTRDPEDAILDTCRELGISFVAYSPLGRGFLAGAVRDPAALDARDFRKTNPRMTPENIGQNLRLLAGVEEIAASRGITVAQLSLAWVLSRGRDIIPIPGTRHEPYLRDNIAATEIELTAAELEKLDALMPRGAAAGTRYTVEGMKRLGL
jgi:aryl-alcohol dehydrogenase-like predicted oxidoreductase